MEEGAGETQAQQTVAMDKESRSNSTSSGFKETRITYPCRENPPCHPGQRCLVRWDPWQLAWRIVMFCMGWVGKTAD